MSFCHRYRCSEISFTAVPLGFYLTTNLLNAKGRRHLPWGLQKTNKPDNSPAAGVLCHLLILLTNIPSLLPCASTVFQLCLPAVYLILRLQALQGMAWLCVVYSYSNYYGSSSESWFELVGPTRSVWEVFPFFFIYSIFLM